MARNRTGLERVRKETLKGVSQEAVARRTSLTTRTYARAEEGKPVKYSSALEILEAINSFLGERGLGRITLEDLTLIIE